MGTKSKSLALVLIALFLTSSVTVLSATSTKTETTWNIQTVDTNGERYGNGYSAIAIDSNNNPHILYTRGIRDSKFWTSELMYASWSNSSWSIQRIDSGDAFDLVLDANNNPHVLYGGKGLMYAIWTGSNWTTQTVDEEFGYGSLALDSSGNPHVAYTSRYGGNETYRLRYGSWTGSNWSIQTLTESENIPFRVFLALDKNNVTYLMYGYSTTHYTLPESYWKSQTLKLAIYKNSNWSTQTVASNLTNYGNMVLDSKGLPHFIYQVQNRESWNSTIYYSSWNGSTWNTEAVVSNDHLDSPNVNIDMGGLAFDSYDYPHIAYLSSEPNGDLNSVMYARWTGKSWDVQTVDSNHPTFNPCYLAVDSNGNPHIRFSNAPSSLNGIRQVMYATAIEPPPIYTPTPNPTAPAFVTSAQMLPIIAAVVVLAVILVSLLLFRRHRKNSSQNKPNI